MRPRWPNYAAANPAGLSRLQSARLVPTVADVLKLFTGGEETSCNPAAGGEYATPEHRWYVAFYQPADGQSARDTWPGLQKYFAFADDG